MTIDDTINSWLGARAPNTRRSYAGVLKEWREHLGRTPLHRVRESHGLTFLASQRGGSSTNATTRRKIVILSSLYQYLVRDGAASVNPFEMCLDSLPAGRGAPIRPHGLISIEHCRALLSSSSERDRAIFALLLGGGLRICEVVGLNSDRISRSEGSAVITLERTKSGGCQSVVISPVFSPLIFSHLDHRLKNSCEGAPLFVSEATEGGRMSISTMRRLIKARYRAVGVREGMTVHSCRATAITRLLEAGVPYREVQEFSRHSSIQMVERYDKRRWGIEDAPGRKLVY